MKICAITKYPPIEGGESSKAYWLYKALANRGHKIFLVTNAYEVEHEFRETFQEQDLNKYQPTNVKVFNTNPFDVPKYIPFTNPFTEKLASLAIEIVIKYNCQLIDSWYILPYVISGYIVKTITKKPQILRHAGSDLSYLLNSPYYNKLFIEIFKRVDKIVTYEGTKQLFLNYGILEEKLFLNKNISVDLNAFNPKIKPFNLSNYLKKDIHDHPIITYIGKIGRTKGIFELIEALGKIKKDFILLLLVGGQISAKLKKDLKNKKIKNKTILLGFLPPWNIPNIIKLSTCVVIPERDFPVVMHNPILPREVMCVGKCTILSEELFNKRKYLELEDGIHTIVINPKDINHFKNKLELVIKNPDFADEIGKNARKLAKKYEDFPAYLNSIEKLYKEVISN